MNPLTRLRSVVRPGTSRSWIVKSMLFWNPLITATIALMTGGLAYFIERFTIALTVAQVVSVEIYVLTSLVFGADDWVRRCRDVPVTKRGFAVHFAVSAGLMPLALPLGFRAAAFVAHSFFHETFETPSFALYRMSVGLGLLFAAAFYLQRSRHHIREHARELENAKLRAELAALGAEMNPHLLFNGLNTVASLIHADPDRAEEVTVQLAELYRAVLRGANGAALHSLADELRLCDAYLEVERARFGDRLVVMREIDDRVDTTKIMVPRLVLQPLIENAVKHGIGSRKEGGRVRLFVEKRDDGAAFGVEDDGVGLGGSTHVGNGRSVKNGRERLRLAFGERAALVVESLARGGVRSAVVMT